MTAALGIALQTQGETASENYSAASAALAATTTVAIVRY